MHLNWKNLFFINSRGEAPGPSAFGSLPRPHPGDPGWEPTDLREPSEAVASVKAEAGICSSVQEQLPSTEVGVGLAGGGRKQQAGVAHHTLPRWLVTGLLSADGSSSVAGGVQLDFQRWQHAPWLRSSLSFYGSAVPLQRPVSLCSTASWFQLLRVQIRSLPAPSHWGHRGAEQRPL